MKNQKKKIVVIGAVVILCAVVIGVMAFSKTGSNNQKPNNNQSVNTNNITLDTGNIEVEQTVFEIPGTKKLGDIEITNIKIEKLDSRKCELTADIKNTSENFIESQNIRVKTIDENGEVAEVFGGLMTTLAPKEPNQFITRVLTDITDASDVEFEVIEN